MEASVLDLRKNMRAVMAAIKRNEHVQLTYRGRLCAVIVPVEETGKCRTSVSKHPVFGLWKDREDLQAPVEYVEQLRKGRVF